MMPVAIAWPISWSWRGGTRRERLLTVALEHYDETGEWPEIGVVQKRLTRFLDFSKARRTARRLPRSLGRLEADGRVVLSIRGIRFVDPNHPALDDFEAVLPWASRSYRSDKRAKAVFSVHDLTQSLPLSAERAQRTMQLIASEGLGLIYPEGELLLTSALVPYLRARGVDDYLKVRRRQDLYRFVGKVIRFPCTVVAWFGSEETSLFKKLVVGVLTVLLAALLLGAILGYSPQQDSAGGDHAPSKSAAARSGE